MLCGFSCFSLCNTVPEKDNRHTHCNAIPDVALGEGESTSLALPTLPGKITWKNMS